MNIKKSVLFTLLSLLFINCSKEKVLSEKDLWYSLNLSNYEMTQQISCFCFPQDFILPKTILVENNSVKLINGMEPIKTIGFESFYTIDELFEFIEIKLKDDPEFYQIKYNDKYGFPESIYFDMSQMIADEEIGYTVSNFKVLKND